jgi:hypothetical protein
MNWIVALLQKEARQRRFNPGDRVRYLTTPRKGTGTTVLMPNFGRGTVVDYDRSSNRYRVKSYGEDSQQENVHPRNLLADDLTPYMPRNREVSETPNTEALNNTDQQMLI